MSFPGSLATRNRREFGTGPKIKKCGGKVPSTEERRLGVKLTPKEIVRREQLFKAKDKRKRIAQRQRGEIEANETNVKRNTGRGRKRSDGVHSRLPQSRGERRGNTGRQETSVRGYLNRDDEGEEESCSSDSESESGKNAVPTPTRKPLSRRERMALAEEKQQQYDPKNAHMLVNSPTNESNGTKVIPKGSLQRVFVSTPCFDSPLTRSLDDVRLDEYARLCGEDAACCFGESPLVARHLICLHPRTMSKQCRSDVDSKNVLNSWLHAVDKIVLYTDLGVSEYMTSVIKFATSAQIQTEFRLLGETWIQSRLQELHPEPNKSCAQENMLLDPVPVSPSSPSPSPSPKSGVYVVEPVLRNSGSESQSEGGNGDEQENTIENEIGNESGSGSGSESESESRIGDLIAGVAATALGSDATASDEENLVVETDSPPPSPPPPPARRRRLRTRISKK